MSTAAHHAGDRVGSWRVLAVRHRGRGTRPRYAVECIECGAWAKRTPYTIGRPCLHPVADEETPFECDLGVVLLVGNDRHPMRLREVADALGGLTRERVRQIEEKAIAKLAELAESGDELAAVARELLEALEEERTYPVYLDELDGAGVSVTACQDLKGGVPGRRWGVSKKTSGGRS